MKQTEPIEQRLEAGNYSLCSCGKSKAMPRCDGAHKGTGIAPYHLKIEPGHHATLRYRPFPPAAPKETE